MKKWPTYFYSLRRAYNRQKYGRLCRQCNDIHLASLGNEGENSPKVRCLNILSKNFEENC